VIVHERVHMSTTVIRPDETFSFARIEATDSFADFVKQGRAEIDRSMRSPTIRVTQGDDAIYHSVIPWIRFTSFSNALPGGTDCVPRIVFGKASEDRGRWMMPVGTEVHHALMDGIDVARFYERFQEELLEPRL
jgi:chloramphenicol O-acetyltransferase type A